MRAALALNLDAGEQAVIELRFGLDGKPQLYDVVKIADHLRVPAYLAHRWLLSGTTKLRAVPLLRRLVSGRAAA